MNPLNMLTHHDVQHSNHHLPPRQAREWSDRGRRPRRAGAQAQAAVPPRQPLPAPVIDPTKPILQLGQTRSSCHNRKRRHRSARLTRWTPGRTPPERTGREKQEAFRIGIRTARVALKRRPQKAVDPPLRARLRSASAALRAVNASLKKNLTEIQRPS